MLRINARRRRRVAARPGLRFGGIALGGLALAWPTGVAMAADPQPYVVTIKPTDKSALDQAMKDSSSLLSLREKAPVGPFALVSRAKDDRTRLLTALHSYGYYKGSVAIVIDGLSVDDGRLPGQLQQMKASEKAKIDISATLGKRYTVGKMVVDGLTAAEQKLVSVKPGDPAEAAPILAVQTDILTALQNDGHALAKVDPPVVTKNDQTDTISVHYVAHPGPRVDIGPITFKGLKDVDAAYIRRRILIHQGQLDTPKDVDNARQDLAGTGVFSSVQIKSADKADANDQIPMEIRFVEGPKHVVGFTGAYSTDLGGSLAATWSDKNLFGQAEQLNLKAAAIDMGGTASEGLGYDFDAQLVKPDIWRRDQSLTFNLEAIKQYLIAYDQQAYMASAIFSRKLNPHWTLSGGLQAEQETIAQEGANASYTFAGIPLTAKFDNTDNLLEPTKGVRLEFDATPTESLTSGSEFTMVRVSGSTYFDLFGDGHSIIAMRATGATVQGAGNLAVPPDQRLYAGGSDTVRGYKYQIVGPQFPDRNPVGGSQLAAATLELRQHIYGDIGMAAFTDVGEVTGVNPTINGQQGDDTSGRLAVGAGLGVRYATPIGPVRLDIALPLVKFPGNDSLEFYIGIGEAF